MAVKKKAGKKAAKKKAVSASASQRKRLPAIGDKQTKAEIVQAIAEETDLTQKDVAAVFSTLGELIERHMKKRGSGEFVIPDSGVKIQRVRKPARKSRVGRNPATGEQIKIPAKPAHTAVRVSALKALKDTLS